MPPRTSRVTRGKSPAVNNNNTPALVVDGDSTPASPPRRSTRHANASASRTTSPQPMLAPPAPNTISQSLDNGFDSGRPPLPVEHANDMIKASARKHPVKEQTLTLEHEKIVIYRQKVPTPRPVSGHIIRRTDTDAVSASSLFRCAFPTASAAQEEDEMRWIAGQYDTVAAGREDEPRGTGKLTGKWIPTSDAVALAEVYGLLTFANDLFQYVSPVAPQNVTLTPNVKGISAANGNAIDINSDDPDASPGAKRAAKRQRVQSPAPSATHNVVTTTQTVVTAPDGSVTETTKVAIEVPESQAHQSNAAESTEEQQIRLVEGAKELVDTLKESHVLTNVDEESATSRGRKRSRDEADAEAEPAVKKRGGWFSRSGQKDRQIAGVSSTALVEAPKPMTPRARRTAAFAGLAVVGLATAAAPWFLG